MDGLEDRGDPEFEAVLREQPGNPGWRYVEPCPPEPLDAVVRLLIDYAR